MASKFVVVWGSERNTQRLIPVDDEYYTDTPQEASEAARALLAKMAPSALVPVAVLEIAPEKFQEMLEGTTPLLTFNQDDEALEQEMLQLVP